MVTIIVNHVVKNYADWRKVFDADAANRSKVDMKITGVFQHIENQNQITITAEASNPEAVKQFFANPELKKTLEKGGVIGMPEVQILKKV